MDWKKLVASLIWAAGISWLDNIYIRAHGVDITAIVTGMFALSPAWAYIAQSVALSFFGQKLEINGADVAKATAEVVNSAPAAIEKAQILRPQLKAGAETKGTPKVLGFFDFSKLDQFSLQSPVNTDPRLTLIGLRDRIAGKVNEIASLAGVPAKCFPSDTVKALRSEGVFPKEFADGLLDLIRYGNAAQDGAKIAVEDLPDPAEYSKILHALDDIIKELTWKLGEGD